MIKIRVFPLPSKRFWQNRDTYCRKVEHKIDGLLDVLPPEYSDPAKVRSVQVIADEYGDPKYVVFTIGD
jgi:hypothetical protein